MRSVIALACFLFSVNAFASDAHPYSITAVHADLQDKKVILTVRTNAEDLLYFHKLDMDSLLRVPVQQLNAAALSHGDIIRTAFYIRDERKKKLPSKITSINASSLQGKYSVDVMSLLKYPLAYTLEFDLRDSIEVLEFHQDLATIGIPAVSFLTVSRNSNTLIENVEMSKDHPFTLIRDAVSIRSSEQNSFMLSYIILDDSRIIHELTIPFEILQSFVPLEGKNQKELLKATEVFITESSSVEVNKTLIRPEVSALIIQTDSSSHQYESSMAHIRIEYALTDVPKGITISWENFNWKMRWFRSLIDAFGKKSEHQFSRFQQDLKIERDVSVKPDTD